MVIVVLSALLGAAILAITQLAYWVRKTRSDVTRLHAELTATKIAALTQLPLAWEEQPPEPARRKRHLALYIGGGAVAILASFGDRLRSLVTRRRAQAVAVAATSVLVAGTAAAYYTANTRDGAAPTHSAPVQSMTAPSSGDIDTPTSEPGAPTGHHTDATSGTRDTTSAAIPDSAGGVPASQLTHPGQTFVADEHHPGSSSYGTPQPPRAHTPDRSYPSAPAPPADTVPPAHSPAPAPPPLPVPQPEPEPSPPPAPTPFPGGTTASICLFPGNSSLDLCIQL
ncbi:hypothetical protein ABT300_34855 [Streptomyces sp. NPDC001027]|uniref:hypothetical protein n=1 Tax=Streptomyces sp. NPDC001027 TaxID=3154771 RepID=UPI0033309473